MDKKQEKRENVVLLLSLAVIVLVVVALAVVGFLMINKPVEVVQGQAEASSVKISGKFATVRKNTIWRIVVFSETLIFASFSAFVQFFKVIWLT